VDSPRLGGGQSTGHFLQRAEVLDLASRELLGNGGQSGPGWRTVRWLILPVSRVAGVAVQSAMEQWRTVRAPVADSPRFRILNPMAS
jgi:hypothetical protein